MRISIINVVAAAFLFVPPLLSGQQVDPSVQAIDPTVPARVQDPDQPNNALLPGGSSAWTGQPMMIPAASSGASGAVQGLGSASRASQFPSLIEMSTWTPSTSAAWAGQSVMSPTPSLGSSLLSSSGSSSGAPGAVQGSSGSVSQAAELQNPAGVSTWGRSSFSIASSLNASGSQGQLQSGVRWTTAAALRKLSLLTPATAAEAARTGRSQDELLEEAFSVEQNRSSESTDKLRKLKQATARSARLRITNPFQSKADASTAPHWGSDESNSRALDQQQHESGLLLKSGFGARTARRKRSHAHGSAAAHAGESR
jgi:hypothetical protein